MIGSLTGVLESMDAPTPPEAAAAAAAGVQHGNLSKEKEPKGCGAEITFSTTHLMLGGGPCGKYCVCHKLEADERNNAESGTDHN